MFPRVALTASSQPPRSRRSPPPATANQTGVLSFETVRPPRIPINADNGLWPDPFKELSNDQPLLEPTSPTTMLEGTSRAFPRYGDNTRGNFTDSYAAGYLTAPTTTVQSYADFYVDSPTTSRLRSIETAAAVVAVAKAAAKAVVAVEEQEVGIVAAEEPHMTKSLTRSGFAGCSTKDFPMGEFIDLDHFTALRFRVKSDGRKYVVSIRTDNWLTVRTRGGRHTHTGTEPSCHAEEIESGPPRR